jgi:hypothetical protein
MPLSQPLESAARLLLLLLLVSGHSAFAGRCQQEISSGRGRGTGSGTGYPGYDSRPFRASGTFAEVPNLLAEYNAGKDFDTVHAKVMQAIRTFRSAD